MIGLKIWLLLTTAATLCAAIDYTCPAVDDPQNVIYYPHPTDCNKYFTCSFGILLGQMCPEGQHWNDEKKYCDNPENANCEQPHSTTQTTTVKPTTNAPSVGKCPDVFDPTHPTFIPHTTDCTKFYICSWGGQAFEKNCPPGLFWNQNKKQCDYECDSGSEVTPAPSSTVPPSDECPAAYDPNHQVHFPHEDCSKYYICSLEGNKLEQNCPPNLHWSQSLGHCDLPEVAQCEAFVCPEGFDPLNPVYVPHEDCTLYYVCVNGQTVEQQCPGDLHWNANMNYCDLPEHAGCASVPALPTVSTEGPAVSKPPVVAPTCPSENGNVPTFFPHEDCTKYYVCEHGHAFEMKCPEGTFWNAQLDACDAPSHSGCKPAGRYLHIKV